MPFKYFTGTHLPLLQKKPIKYLHDLGQWDSTWTPSIKLLIGIYIEWTMSQIHSNMAGQLPANTVYLLTIFLPRNLLCLTSRTRSIWGPKRKFLNLWHFQETWIRTVKCEHQFFPSTNIRNREALHLLGAFPSELLSAMPVGMDQIALNENRRKGEPLQENMECLGGHLNLRLRWHEMKRILGIPI